MKLFTIVMAALIMALSCGEGNDTKSDKNDQETVTDSDNNDENDRENSDDLLSDNDQITAENDSDQYKTDDDSKEITYKDDVEKIADWLTGKFSSEKQSKEPFSQYWDIRLYMVRIWKQRTDGYWLYVEQARVDYITQPYRQRIYNLFMNENGQVQNVNYEFKGNPSGFANPWNNLSIFEDFTPEEILIVKEGCDVFFNETEEYFSGGTVEQNCKTDYNGAVYATSDFTVKVDGLTSLDRGWDADGNIKFGPTEGMGPYVFDKLEDFPIKE